MIFGTEHFVKEQIAQTGISIILIFSFSYMFAISCTSNGLICSLLHTNYHV